MRFTMHSAVSILVGLFAVSALIAQGPPTSGPPASGPPTPIAPSLTVQVDCDAGETLADALAERADELTVEFSGSCAEEVVIRRDRTRIVGVAPGAEIVGNPSPVAPFGGGITVQGASNVTLADFTIRGARRGITVLDGGVARLERLTVRDNVRDGVFIQGARAWIESLTILDNGGDGVAAWDSSSVIFAFDATTVIRRSGRAGVLASGSSDVSGFVTSRVESDDAPFGIALQLGASSQNLGLAASGNTFGVFALLEASYSDTVDLRNNESFGVLVSDGAMVDLRGSIEDNGFVGIWGEYDATVTFSGTISGHSLGIRLDGTEAFVSNATVNDFVELLFGTRVDFAGGNSFTGGVSCDGTVLVRGDVACPAPLSSLRMGGVSQGTAGLVADVSGPLSLVP